MMHPNVPAILSDSQPSPGMFFGALTEAEYNERFPADLVANPDVYEAELIILFHIAPDVKTLWETGQEDYHAARKLTAAVISIACDRFRQQLGM